MKAVLSIALFLNANLAFAANVNLDQEAGYDSVPVYYNSWCSQNSIMQEGQNGEVVEQKNCSELALTCEEKSVYRMRNLIINATCEAK